MKIIKWPSWQITPIFSYLLQLRYLQTLNSISAEKNSTIIFPLPIGTYALKLWLSELKQFALNDPVVWILEWIQITLIEKAYQCLGLYIVIFFKTLVKLFSKNLPKIVHKQWSKLFRGYNMAPEPGKTEPSQFFKSFYISFTSFTQFKN